MLRAGITRPSWQRTMRLTSMTCCCEGALMTFSPYLTSLSVCATVSISSNASLEWSPRSRMFSSTRFGVSSPLLQHALNSFPLSHQFQDTNGTQYSLVKLIAKACQSLTIVGDPDQSSESSA